MNCLSAADHPEAHRSGATHGTADPARDLPTNADFIWSSHAKPAPQCGR